MYPTPNELSSYSPAWPCAHFRLAGGVNALAGVLLLLRVYHYKDYGIFCFYIKIMEYFVYFEYYAILYFYKDYEIL